MLKQVVLALTLASAGLAMAQNMNAVEESRHSDKPLSYTITLDAPVKGTVTTIFLSFHLISEPRPDQRGLQENFDLTMFKKLSDVQYEVSQPQRPHVMSGTYRLDAIQLRTDGGIANYAYTQEFKQEITVHIDTPGKDIFPGIKSVEPSHQ